LKVQFHRVVSRWPAVIRMQVGTRASVLFCVARDGVVWRLTSAPEIARAGTTDRGTIDRGVLELISLGSTAPVPGKMRKPSLKIIRVGRRSSYNIGSLLGRKAVVGSSIHGLN
jgi:hypothetical protein